MQKAASGGLLYEAAAEQADAETGSICKISGRGMDLKNWAGDESSRPS